MATLIRRYVRLLLLCLVPCAFAQIVGGPRVGHGLQDNSIATMTKPMRTSDTLLTGSCSNGEQYAYMNGASGQSLYLCKNSVWELQASGTGAATYTCTVPANSTSAVTCTHNLGGIVGIVGGACRLVGSPNQVEPGQCTAIDANSCTLPFIVTLPYDMKCTLQKIDAYAAPTIALSPSSPLTAGTQGTAYTASITASGGTSPYTYAVTSGTLPAGLTLSSSGALTGTPTGTGTASFTVTATDAASYTGSLAYSLTIAAGGGSMPSGAVLTYLLNEGSGEFAANSGSWGTSYNLDRDISGSGSAPAWNSPRGFVYSPSGSVAGVVGASSQTLPAQATVFMAVKGSAALSASTQPLYVGNTLTGFGGLCDLNGGGARFYYGGMSIEMYTGDICSDGALHIIAIRFDTSSGTLGKVFLDTTGPTGSGGGTYTATSISNFILGTNTSQTFNGLIYDFHMYPTVYSDSATLGYMATLKTILNNAGIN